MLRGTWEVGCAVCASRHSLTHYKGSIVGFCNVGALIIRVGFGGTF